MTKIEIYILDIVLYSDTMAEMLQEHILKHTVMCIKKTYQLVFPTEVSCLYENEI